MLIPIPVGRKHVAAVEGTFWKFVVCERCRERYAYLLHLEGKGEDHDVAFLDGEASAQRARLRAEENLALKGENVVLPVPCPKCGAYQPEMAALLRDEESINPLQLIGVAVTGLSLVALALDYAYAWVVTVVVGSIGVAMLVAGYRLSLGFDPGAGDAEERKALGRAHAVWGERLDDLLAADPAAAGAARAAGVIRD